MYGPSQGLSYASDAKHTSITADSVIIEHLATHNDEDPRDVMLQADVMHKKQDRKLRNRIHARNARERQRQYMKAVEYELLRLQQEIAELKTTNQRLVAENAAMQNAVAENAAMQNAAQFLVL